MKILKALSSTASKEDSRNFSKIIEIITEEIKECKVLVLPTDTVYGLIADATNKEAVEKIFRIKGRDRKKPTPLFVGNIKEAKRLAKIDKRKEKVLNKIWPGKVTVVFQKKKRVKIFGTDRKTIGLRIPSYKLINLLLRKTNRPLTGTSANISGKRASTRIGRIISQFEKKKNKPDLILDAGDLKKSAPSTIIDFKENNLKVLRKGEVKFSEITKLL